MNAAQHISALVELNTETVALLGLTAVKTLEWKLMSLETVLQN